MQRIKDLFWKEEERGSSGKTGKTPAPEAVPAAAANRPMVVGSLNGAAPAASIAPHEDPQVRAQLEKAMLSDGDNSVGKFREAVANLAEDIPELGTRIRVAFKTLRASGLTPEAVVADLASDERILAAKQREFQQFIAGKRQTGLGARQAEMESITAAIAQKHEQIEALKREIAELGAKQTQLETATRTDAQKYAEVEGNFETTLAAVRAERQQIMSQVQPFCTNTK